MNIVTNAIKKILGNELVAGSMYVFLGTTFSNFLAFILNLFFARSLTYSDYGTYIALLSLFSLATIPGQSLVAIIVKFATQFHSLGETDKFSLLYRKTISLFFLAGLGIIAISAIISGSASEFLHIGDSSLIVFVAIIVFVNYLLTVNLSYLNSLLKFKELSLSYIISGIFKLLTGILLVSVGLRVYGALGAMLLLLVAQLLYSIFPVWKHVIVKAKNIKLPLFEMFKYSIPASIAIFSLFSFVSSDVILVKHFFSAKDAGLYGGLSLVGKVIFYFTLPIPAVMFPLVVKRYARNESHSKLLYIALLAVIGPSIFVTAFYFLFPGPSLSIFLGGRDYLRLIPYLGWFGLFLSIHSLNNVFVTYFLSIHKSFMSLFVLFFAIMQVSLIALYHNGFIQIINVSILSSVLLLTSLVLYYLKISLSARD